MNIIQKSISYTYEVELHLQIDRIDEIDNCKNFNIFVNPIIKNNKIVDIVDSLDEDNHRCKSSVTVSYDHPISGRITREESLEIYDNLKNIILNIVQKEFPIQDIINTTIATYRSAVRNYYGDIKRAQTQIVSTKESFYNDMISIGFDKEIIDATIDKDLSPLISTLSDALKGLVQAFGLNK